MKNVRKKQMHTESADGRLSESCEVNRISETGSRLSHPDSEQEFRRIAQMIRESHGEAAVRHALIHAHLLDPRLLPDEDEVRQVRTWDFAVSADGRLFKKTYDGLVELPIVCCFNGRRYVEQNDFKVWIANAVFEAFATSVPKEYTVEPLDGDRGNCRIENLFLLRKSDDALSASGNGGTHLQSSSAVPGREKMAASPIRPFPKLSCEEN